MKERPKHEPLFLDDVPIWDPRKTVIEAADLKPHSEDYKSPQLRNCLLFGDPSEKYVSELVTEIIEATFDNPKQDHMTRTIAVDQLWCNGLPVVLDFVFKSSVHPTTLSEIRSSTSSPTSLASPKFPFGSHSTSVLPVSSLLEDVVIESWRFSPSPINIKDEPENCNSGDNFQSIKQSGIEVLNSILNAERNFTDFEIHDGSNRNLCFGKENKDMQFRSLPVINTMDGPIQIDFLGYLPGNRDQKQDLKQDTSEHTRSQNQEHNEQQQQQPQETLKPEHDQTQQRPNEQVNDKIIVEGSRHHQDTEGLLPYPFHSISSLEPFEQPISLTSLVDVTSASSMVSVTSNSSVESTFSELEDSMTSTSASLTCVSLMTMSNSTLAAETLSRRPITPPLAIGKACLSSSASSFHSTTSRLMFSTSTNDNQHSQRFSNYSFQENRTEKTTDRSVSKISASGFTAYNSNTGLPLSSSPYVSAEMLNSATLDEENELFEGNEKELQPTFSPLLDIDTESADKESDIIVSCPTTVSQPTSAPKSKRRRKAVLKCGSICSHVAARLRRKRLLGNFEESLFSGGLSNYSGGCFSGFVARLGAIGPSLCPEQVDLPFKASFYRLPDEDNFPPYVAHVNMCEILNTGSRPGMYRVPIKGSLNLAIFNPNHSIIKVFVISYDFTEMPPRSKTFIRQRHFIRSDSGDKRILYVVHIPFVMTKNRRVYVYGDLKLIFSHYVDGKVESEIIHPSNPQFIPLKSEIPL